jgi:hypothetical protein
LVVIWVRLWVRLRKFRFDSLYRSQWAKDMELSVSDSTKQKIWTLLKLPHLAMRPLSVGVVHMSI